jgi:S-adenosylmethionine/arginine decarboxylase-like enzyme
VSELEYNRTMRLHALDAWVRSPSILTDADRVKQILYAGADAGGATVLGEKFCVLPTGAVTGVLVLAQSHLTIHTWPEFVPRSRCARGPSRPPPR